MQIAIIAGPTHETAHSRICLANKINYIDGIELRLDLFRSIELHDIQQLINLAQGKVIVTLRSKKSGGGFTGSIDTQKLLLESLLHSQPSYMDIEYDTAYDCFSHLNDLRSKHEYSTKFILSYHNVKETPKCLESILRNMSDYCPDIYKICTMARYESDGYRMLLFIRRHQKHKKIIGLCMGEKGKMTRSDGIKSGNYLNYVILHYRDKETLKTKFLPLLQI